MAYGGKQVLMRIPAYLPSEPYQRVYSPRHLPNSGSSSLKSDSSYFTSSDSTSARQPNAPRIVRTPSRCRNGVYTYEDNRSYSKMAEPLRTSRNSSAGGRKRKYTDTPAHLNPSRAAWRNSATSLYLPPNGDFPANLYRIPQATEVPIGNGLPDQPLGNSPYRKSSLNGPVLDNPRRNSYTRSNVYAKRQQQTPEGPVEHCPFVFNANPRAHIYDRHPNEHIRSFEPSAVKNSQNLRVYTSNPALNVIPQSEFWPRTQEDIEDSACFRHNYEMSLKADFPGSDVYGQSNQVGYPLRKTASMFHLGGESRDRSSAVFDAGVKAKLLRARLSESKDLDDLLRFADGTYDGNEFDFNVKTKGLGGSQDLEGFQDLKIAESHEEQNEQSTGLQKSSTTSCTDDNSALSPIKLLHVSVDEKGSLDNQADDALAELNKALEVTDSVPSQPVRPQPLPNDGRHNIAEQVILRLNGECDLRDSRPTNRSPPHYPRENVHAHPASGGHCGVCHSHSWNADNLRNPRRQSSLIWRSSEPFVVHGLVEREPRGESPLPPSGNQVTTAQARKPYSYPRVHQSLQQQQAWQANEKHFGRDDWGKNGVTVMQTCTILRPSPEVGTVHTNQSKNQKNEALHHRNRTSSTNSSDASSIDLDDSYGLGE